MMEEETYTSKEIMEAHDVSWDTLRVMESQIRCRWGRCVEGVEDMETVHKGTEDLIVRGWPHTASSIFRRYKLGKFNHGSPR